MLETDSWYGWKLLTQVIQLVEPSFFNWRRAGFLVSFIHGTRLD